MNTKNEYVGIYREFNYGVDSLPYAYLVKQYTGHIKSFDKITVINAPSESYYKVQINGLDKFNCFKIPTTNLSEIDCKTLINQKIKYYMHSVGVNHEDQSICAIEIPSHKISFTENLILFKNDLNLKEKMESAIQALRKNQLHGMIL